MNFSLPHISLPKTKSARGLLLTAILAAGISLYTLLDSDETYDRSEDVPARAIGNTGYISQREEILGTKITNGPTAFFDNLIFKKDSDDDFTFDSAGSIELVIGGELARNEYGNLDKPQMITGLQLYMNQQLKLFNHPPIAVNGNIDDEFMKAVIWYREIFASEKIKFGDSDLTYEELDEEELKLITQTMLNTNRIADFVRGELDTARFNNALAKVIRTYVSRNDLSEPEVIRQFQVGINTALKHAKYAIGGTIPSYVPENGKRTNIDVEVLQYLWSNNDAIQAEMESGEKRKLAEQKNKKQNDFVAWFSGIWKSFTGSDEVFFDESVGIPEGEYTYLRNAPVVWNTAYLKDIVGEHNYDIKKFQKRLDNEMSEAREFAGENYLDESLVRVDSFIISGNIDEQTTQTLQDLRLISLIQHISENFTNEKRLVMKEELQEKLRNKVRKGEIQPLDKGHEDINWEGYEDSGRWFVKGTTLCVKTTVDNLQRVFKIDPMHYTPDNLKNLPDYDIDDKDIDHGQFYDSVNGTRRTRIMTNAYESIKWMSFHPDFAWGLPLERIPVDVFDNFANFVEYLIYKEMDEQNTLVTLILHNATKNGHMSLVYLDTNSENNPYELIVPDAYYTPPYKIDNPEFNEYQRDSNEGYGKNRHGPLRKHLYKVRQRMKKTSGDHEKVFMPMKFGYQKGQKGNQGD